MRSILLLALLFSVGGCASYHYEVLQPPGISGFVASDQPTIIKTEVLEYHLQTADSRLVMQIYNPTPDPVQLLGAQSSVVDPGGQSHPLHDQTIAPGSYVKLILPPFAPQVAQEGPQVEFGVGTFFHHGFVGTEVGTPPQYVVYNGETGIYYWEWNGPGDVNLTIVFHRRNQMFQQAFVIRRVLS